MSISYDDNHYTMSESSVTPFISDKKKKQKKKQAKTKQ